MKSLQNPKKASKEKIMPLKSAMLTIAAITTLLISNIKTQQKMTLKKRVPLPLTFQTYNLLSYASMELKIAAQSANSSLGFSVPMIPDFSESKIFVGSLGELNWGINCNEWTLCKETSTVPESCARDQKPTLTATCLKADTYIRFRDQKLSTEVPMIPVNILQEYQTWKPTQIGFLGMSPKSPFWDYIVTSFNNEQPIMDISFFYRANNIDKLFDQGPESKNFKNALVTFNGNSIFSKPAFVDVSMDKTFWLLEFATLSRKANQEQPEAVKVGIANSLNVTFLIKNFDEFKKGVFKELCDNEEGCKRVGSQVNQVDNVILRFANSSTPDDGSKQVEIVIQPEEMFYFDDDGDCILLIDDITKPEYQTSFDPDADLVLGLLAFGKREILFRAFDNKTMQISFEEFQPDVFYFVILAILLGILSAVFFVVCGVATYNRLKGGDRPLRRDEESLQSIKRVLQSKAGASRLVRRQPPESTYEDGTAVLQTKELESVQQQETVPGDQRTELREGLVQTDGDAHPTTQ